MHGFSGPDSGYRARRALHLYIIDLLANYDPFLNTSNVCYYPDGYQAPRQSKQQPLAEKPNTNLNASLYEGVYGRCGYGNIAVIENATSGMLQLMYSSLGQWVLYETGTNNSFTAEGIGESWYFSMNDLSFGEYDEVAGKMTELTITSFEPRDPPVFIRDADVSGCS